MKILGAEFLKSIVNEREKKFGELPEIAFIGRSNVGKSSLINCLLMRKIARTSSLPGATRTINLYRVEYEHMAKRRSAIFSDFPGFGYTALPRFIYERWERMIDSYVSNNPMVRRIIWVLDIRRNFDALDELTWRWLESKEIPFSFAVTKIDKVSKDEMRLRKDKFLNIIGDIPVFFVSAKERTGRKELLVHLIDSLR